MKNSKKSQSGFTLIEMAIVTLIIGIAIAAMSPLFTQYISSQQQLETEGIVTRNLTKQITTFRNTYGRYPCPAGLAVARDKVDYGREDCSLAAAEEVAGTCSGEGVCVSQSTRLGYLDFINYNEATPPTISPRILYGFIPFRDLGLMEDDVIDGYNNRIAYAVTENLTNRNSFDPEDGAIQITDEANRPLTIQNDAHFIVFSHGKNGAGAYTMAGVRKPCPANDSLEIRNTDCNVNSNTNLAAFVVAEQSSGDNNKFFDNVSAYFSPHEMPIWERGEKSNDPNISTENDVFLKPQNGLLIGAKLKNDEVFEGLKVSEHNDQGAIKAENTVIDEIAQDNGKIIADRICDKEGKNALACFNARLFMGDTALSQEGYGFECDKGEFLKSLKNGKFECVDDITKKCPEGSYLTGFKDGELICADAPTVVGPNDCAAETITMCEEDTTIGPMAHGKSKEVRGGESKRSLYVCYDGKYVPRDNSGRCNCVPDSKIQTRQCWEGYTPGTQQVLWERVCPKGNEVLTVIDNSQCKCVEDYEKTIVKSCPPGQYGKIYEILKAKCKGAHREWKLVETLNKCSCSQYIQDTTTTKACPPGYKGEITQKWVVDCKKGGLVTDGPPVDNCTCEPKPAEQKTRSCGPGQTGEVTYTESIVCKNNIPEVSITNEVENCTEIVCNWKPSGSSFQSTFGAGQNVGSTCKCGKKPKACFQRSGASSYTQYNQCTCE